MSAERWWRARGLRARLQSCGTRYHRRRGARSSLTKTSMRWSSSPTAIGKVLVPIGRGLIVRATETMEKDSSENPMRATSVERLVSEHWWSLSSPHLQRQGAFPGHDHHLCFDSVGRFGFWIQIDPSFTTSLTNTVCPGHVSRRKTLAVGGDLDHWFCACGNVIYSGQIVNFSVIVSFPFGVLHFSTLCCWPLRDIGFSMLVVCFWGMQCCYHLVSEIKSAKTIHQTSIHLNNFR